MFAIGKAHGKFGELLQGMLPGENEHFLVTLPILRYSVAKFNYTESKKQIIVYPPHKIKSASLVKKILDYFGLYDGWTLTIESELEEGKGLGSSTADMVASARAISQAIGRELPIDVLMKFLKEIEPTDGIMYEGIVCFYHRHVVLHSQLGYLKGLMIIGCDEGGIIDTVRYNQNLKNSSHDDKLEYAKLLNELIGATKKIDLNHIGAISTRSAVLHQAINPKKNLSFMMSICNAVQALGVIVAHSGTFIGIILDINDAHYKEKLFSIEEEMRSSLLIPERFHVISNEMDYLLTKPKILSTESVC